MAGMGGLIRAFLVVTAVTLCGVTSAAVTTVTATRGHYPHAFCEMTSMVIDTQSRKMAGNIRDTSQQQYLQSHCSIVVQMFGVEHDPQAAKAGCDVNFARGHVFTMYYHYGSNYFHLHYDMMLPLFSEFRLLYKGKRGSVALLPSVETSRLQHIDWSTPAFADKSTYWMQMLKVLAGDLTLLPIDESLTKKYKTICFDKLYFGTPNTEFTDKFLIHSYVTYVLDALQVESSLPADHRIGLIHRENRRLILNEEELLEAWRKESKTPIDLIEFTGMTFREQVQEVQRYSVIVGINGAGLTNALYRHPGAVAVQLVPYNATVNFREFGELLKTRGPYLEWHNTHPELSVTFPSDKFNSQADTKVHVDEFLALMKKAIQMIGSGDYSTKSEL